MDEKRTLSRGESLKSRGSIDRLFKNGKNIKSGPIVLLYNVEPLDDFPVKIGVSVPKRRFKKAVDRNRLKRQIREVYRLHQNPLYSLMKEQQKQLSVFFIYRGSETFNYKALEGKIIVTLSRLETELRKELTDE